MKVDPMNVQQKLGELIEAIRAEVVAEITARIGRLDTKPLYPSVSVSGLTTTPYPNPPRMFKRKGEKRTPADLAKLSHGVHKYVINNPGNGVEAMSRALGVPSRELVLPIKKLIALGTIVTKGHKRATKYHLAARRKKARR